MSKSSERSRALNAARRFATSVRLRDNPVGRAVKAAFSGKNGKAAAPAAAAGAPNWRIESLEPKLLLSADALPGVHQRVDADTLQTVQAPAAPADAAQGPGARMAGQNAKEGCIGKEAGMSVPDGRAGSRCTL